MNKLLIISVCGLATAAHAEFKTGNQLWNQMNGDSIDRVHAMGYVAGVADVGHGVQHCAPSGVTLGQAFDVVKQSMERTPSIRHLSADVLVNAALAVTWPCANNRRNNGGTNL